MRVDIQNQAELTKGQVNRIRNKMMKLPRYFKDLIYAEVKVSAEGNDREYRMVAQLGVPGNDVIVRQKGQNLNQLISSVQDACKRQLKELFQRN